MERAQRSRSYDGDDVICAAVQGDLELLNQILTVEKQCNPYSRRLHEIAVQYAAKMGHMHILETLPLRSVWPHHLLAQMDGVKRSMCNAAANGNIEVLDWFAEQLSINKLSVTHVIGSTNGNILGEAAKNNQIQTLKWFEKYVESELLEKSSVIYGAMYHAAHDIVRNNSIEAYEWLKARGATIGYTFDMHKLCDLCMKYSPYMLREMIEYYSDQLNKPRRYNGAEAPALGEMFITSAMNAENFVSFRVLAESKAIDRKQWILASQKGTKWGLTHAFGRLWKEDYVALQKLDVWKHRAATCVANAIVAQRAGTVCERGLPNELWLYIMNLM